MAGFNAFLKNNNIITGTAIPTEGNFKTGDIIVNVGPNSATEPMWICNEGGNPGIWGPVGVGSGSIVSINSSVLISEPTNEISLTSLGVGVSSKDKLLVHYNSTHLLEGVHFEISNDGSKIVKLGGGNWNPDGLENCIFALELFKGVESIDGDKIVVDSKMTSITNHVVIENACSEVEIGIEGFNAGNDMMLVFKNGVNMVEGVDYEVQGGKIVSTGEVWNENGIEDYGMTFVVFKEVVEYNGDAEVKAENIADGSIGMEHLNEDVREAIEAAGNIDLSGKQDKSDEGLVTTDKTIVGAINELFQNANNGKTIIADAIGSPLSSDDTFAAMGNEINGLLSSFRTQLGVKGVTSSNDEKFQELINKINNINQEVGMQVVSGTGISTNKSTYKNYSVISGSSSGSAFTYLEINGLDFEPSIIFVSGIAIENSAVDMEINVIFNKIGGGLYGPCVTRTNFSPGLATPSAQHNIRIDDTVVNNNIYYIPINYNGNLNAPVYSCNWIAIGTIQNPKPAQSITPGVNTQVLDAGYYTGDITINGDSDLVAGNIKSGVNIFGVTGTAPVPSGNVTAAQVLSGRTFSNGSGVGLKGTMPNRGAYTASNSYVANSGTQLHIGIPQGAYLTNTSTGSPEIQIDNSKLNLYPENIKAGVTVGGITGTMQPQSYSIICPTIDTYHSFSREEHIRWFELGYDDEINSTPCVATGTYTVFFAIEYCNSTDWTVRATRNDGSIANEYHGNGDTNTLSFPIYMTKGQTVRIFIASKYGGLAFVDCYYRIEC